uniref:Synaptophysin-like protein 1 n=1 Tax=Aceria tosichella TaxID=561515 RepID=A0A6G1SKM5_9ACAR
MDLDNFQQNMNTRVVFREPRGMVRWLQLLFCIIAISTVADFYTSVGIEITCPPTPANSTNQPIPAPANSTNIVPNNASTPAPQVTAQEVKHLKLDVQYPFDFSSQGDINNNCPGHNYTYNHKPGLNGSPQFFVMTGALSLIYVVVSLVVYLFFSNTYESVPIWPIADLIIGGILVLFWFIAASSFSSGVTLLKSTVIYENMEQVLCPPLFKQAGALCKQVEYPTWKSLNIGLVSGFTEFFLWGSGMWFVYKETTFHQPRDAYSPR